MGSEWCLYAPGERGDLFHHSDTHKQHFPSKKKITKVSTHCHGLAKCCTSSVCIGHFAIQAANTCNADFSLDEFQSVAFKLYTHRFPGKRFVRSGIRTHAWRTRLRPERSALDRSAILTPHWKCGPSRNRLRWHWEWPATFWARSRTSFAAKKGEKSVRDGTPFVSRDSSGLPQGFRSVVVITFA